MRKAIKPRRQLQLPATMDPKKIGVKSGENIPSSTSPFKFTFNPPSISLTNTPSFSLTNTPSFSLTNTPSLSFIPSNTPRTFYINHSWKLLKKIYEESICCDVVLKAGTTEFKCHKNVLAGMSSHFQAMFKDDATEKVADFVDLSNDLKDEELKAILEYIYLQKDEFPHLTAASYQTLYRVSDKFQLPTFQEICEAALIGKLTLDNATDLFIFAAEFGSKALKKAAAKVIADGPD